MKTCKDCVQKRWDIFKGWMIEAVKAERLDPVPWMEDLLPSVKEQLADVRCLSCQDTERIRQIVREEIARASQ